MGERIGLLLKKNSVITLEGTLGAGKTTLVKGIAKGLDIENNIVSPTFTLIQEYLGRLQLYHMDLYRIDSAEEFELLGAEEMFYADGVCIIEWSEIAKDFLPKDLIEISIDINEDKSRDIKIEGLDL